MRSAADTGAGVTSNAKLRARTMRRRTDTRQTPFVADRPTVPAVM